jgi:hypothetical protein
MDSTQKEKMTQVADPHNAPDMNPYKTNMQILGIEWIDTFKNLTVILIV